MGGMSNDVKRDTITEALLQSIQLFYHKILNQYNMSIDEMNLQQLEERLKALNRSLETGSLLSDETRSRMIKEKKEVVDRILYLRGE